MKSATVVTTVLALTAGLTLIGCGVQPTGDAASTTAEIPSSSELADQENVGKANFFAAGAGERFATTPAGLNRKIIYNAEIELAVEDFTGVPDRVIELVKQFDGFVADSRLSGSTGNSRHGSWKIRVPVANFEAFTGAAQGLGELIRAGTSSRDVSEEYYDVEARIRNKTTEEDRLLALLEDRPGKLTDVIAIEHELSRVREEIERMQGRLRVLTDLTSLTTVELSIVEIRDYQPPEAPTLATRVRRSFQGSLATMVSIGEQILIAGVAISPWLPVVAVGVCPIYVAWRRVRRTK